MITLVVEGSGGSELTYELTKAVVSVGASSQNDVIIRSPGVAPRHLVIQRNGDVLTFLGQSRQVVVLNGERRSRGLLRPGDRLRVGSAALVVKNIEESVAELDNGVSASAVEGSPAPEANQASENRKVSASKRSEVVLYSEPSRVAEARSHLVDILRGSPHADLVPLLESYLARSFSDRPATVAVLDGNGILQPVVAKWDADLPRLPARTFDELRSDGRFALIRLGSRQLLIFPIDRGNDNGEAYLIAETNDDSRDDDELLLAELARMLAICWARIEKSGALFGAWETANRKLVEERLPGSSPAVQALRDAILKAARSPYPVLICGEPGAGRSWVARLISSIHPSTEPPTEVFLGDEDAGDRFRVALFGPDTAGTLQDVMDRHGRGTTMLLREVQAFDLESQALLAEIIRDDLASDFGPTMRWIATTRADCVNLVNQGSFDPQLFRLFHRHFLAVPSLEERREDVALLIVRLLEEVGAELGRELRGIHLETLNSLLLHTFEGQVAELVGELRRLVAATPSGDVVRGAVPPVLRSGGGGATPIEDSESATAALLASDDLKNVIPSVERLIIDRVLRRTLGNQSKAARLLNLSRGALIAKMKEFEIPDYRYLRRRR